MKPDWTEDMYAYLNWKLFEEFFQITSCPPSEQDKFKPLIEASRLKLTREQTLIVENRARRMKDEYRRNLAEELHRIYGDDFYDEEGFDYRDNISYDDRIYNIWSSAVRKKQTVKMTYDSPNSGISERLVNPYKTRAPYGMGYCHKRKEVRQFRFDRVIDIKLTEKTFAKPKDWED